MTRNGDTDRVRSGTKVVRKIFLTILIGGAAFAITNLSGEELIWQLTVSIIIGGITLLVQFLRDFENLLEKVQESQEGHSVEMRSMMQDGFAKTHEATELFQAVEASAVPIDTITQLVRHAARISPAAPRLVCELAKLQINQTLEFLKELSEGGVVEYEGEDRDWMLGLTMQAKNTIDATSLSTVDAGGKSFHGGLWTSDLGRRYLTLQRQAMSRGVVIRRVFIIDRPGQASEADFQSVCQQHKELGIKVRVLDRSEIIDASILEASMIDFVVFDSVLSYEATPASMVEDGMRPTIVNTHLKLQPERVKERMQRFEDLWASAQELK